MTVCSVLLAGLLLQDFADPIEAMTSARTASTSRAAGLTSATGAPPGVRPVGKAEAWGVGKYFMAFLLKEAVVAAAEGDSDRMNAALRHTVDPNVWVNAGAFSIGARSAERAGRKLLSGAPGNFAAGGATTLGSVGVKGLTKALGRTALPIAAGLATVQIVTTGRLDASELASSTAKSFLASAALYPADLMLRAYLYPALIASGPAGWIAIGAIEVGKLALTLYLMEKLETEWNPLETDAAAQAAPSAVWIPPAPAFKSYRGVKPKIDWVRDRVPM